MKKAVNQSKGTYLTLVSAFSIHNGDFYTNAGTRLHFNEEGVILVRRLFADAIIGWWTVANVMRTPIESEKCFDEPRKNWEPIKK